jgi:hypothetical protein
MVVKNVTKINSTLAARKFNNNKKKNDFEGEKIHTNYFSGIPVIPSASEGVIKIHFEGQKYFKIILWFPIYP